MKAGLQSQDVRCGLFGYTRPLSRTSPEGTKSPALPRINVYLGALPGCTEGRWLAGRPGRLSTPDTPPHINHVPFPSTYILCETGPLSGFWVRRPLGAEAPLSFRSEPSSKRPRRSPGFGRLRFYICATLPAAAAAGAELGRMRYLSGGPANHSLLPQKSPAVCVSLRPSAAVKIDEESKKQAECCVPAS